MAEYQNNFKILYVDDEPNLLLSFKSLLRKEKFKVITSQQPEEIEQLLETEGPFALVLADERMPEMPGHKMLSFVKDKHPDTMRVLITGFASYEDTINAINHGGIYKYISKPWDEKQLIQIIDESVSIFNSKMEKEFILTELREEFLAIKNKNKI